MNKDRVVDGKRLTVSNCHYEGFRLPENASRSLFKEKNRLIYFICFRAINLLNSNSQWRLPITFFLLFLAISAQGLTQFNDPFNLLSQIQITKKDPCFQKSSLEKIIENGAYAFIEASSFNSEHFSQEMKYQRFYELGSILTENSFPNRQIVGSYDGEVTVFSYLVLKPEKISSKEFRRIIFKLGQQFDQESVILSSSGIVQLVFTTGSKAGRAYLGKGFKTTVNRNFSIVKCDCINPSECNVSEQYLIIGEYDLDRNLLSGTLEEFEDLLNSP